MYQITRKNRIKETLQLCYSDRTVAHTIDIDINADQIAGRVNKAYEALGAAQEALQSNPDSEQLVEAYGNAVFAVFDVIFGEENRKKIVEFYENNYSEMLLDLFPFINNVILPQIREANADRKAQLLEAAKLAKQSNKAAARRSWKK